MPHLRSPVLALMIAAASVAARAESVRGDPLTVAVYAARSAQAATPNDWIRAQAASQYPQTSVDHHFSGDKVVGSAGFLCGLAPDHTQSGGASIFGYDPHGRFVGAQLKFAFR